jgi:hypothetical protein
MGFTGITGLVWQTFSEQTTTRKDASLTWSSLLNFYTVLGHRFWSFAPDGRMIFGQCADPIAAEESSVPTRSWLAMSTAKQAPTISRRSFKRGEGRSREQFHNEQVPFI